MKFGLDEDKWEEINAVFKKYPNVKKVILYGSRAINTYKNGSDIDLSLVGSNLDLSLQNCIANDLDDLLLPYSFDLAIYERIDNPKLKEHIDNLGVVIFSRDE